MVGKTGGRWGNPGSKILGQWGKFQGVYVSRYDFGKKGENPGNIYDGRCDSGEQNIKGVNVSR